MAREPWRYDPRWGTAIDLDGCQFGFEIDGRCNMILCKFRTTKDLAPKEPRETCRVLCPRELKYNESPGKTTNCEKPAVV